MMIDNNYDREQYYGLARQSIAQRLIFITIFIMLIITLFNIALPLTQKIIIEDYLQGKVYNDGRSLPYTEEDKKVIHTTNYYNQWAIDVFIGTTGEARYWFDPIISLAMPIILFSFIFTLIISSVLPINIGLIRRKIEREIINQLDKIHYSNYGYYSDERNKDTETKILNADERELHTMAAKWKINKEEIMYLASAIKWRNYSIFYKIIHTFDSLKFYLRFYFTESYGNTMLGFVYIGAAVLIIIIGMRGLKFIPSTQPSLIFFALGLEFSVLIAYAVTVIFSKNDSDSDSELIARESKDSELKNSKEIENLLLAFLKKPNK